MHWKYDIKQRSAPGGRQSGNDGSARHWHVSVCSQCAPRTVPYAPIRCSLYAVGMQPAMAACGL